MSLSPSDRHHLEAAEGWLEPGNFLEANEELERIEAKMRAHPEVLLMRARVFAEGRKWDVVLELVDKVTDAVAGFVKRSVEEVISRLEVAGTDGIPRLLKAQLRFVIESSVTLERVSRAIAESPSSSYARAQSSQASNFLGKIPR